MSKTVGVIGLGIMGGAISANLVDRGFPVIGYDIDEGCRARLVEAGGAVAASPRELAAACDIVITSLPTVAALDAVLGNDGGVVASGNAGLILVECSTFPIEDKLRGRDALDEAGMVMLDCPLSGTGAQAVKRDLSIYASGDQAAYETCVPVFEGFGRSHYFLGEFGNGSRMKFVANLLVAIHNVAAAEAFVLGMKSGLEPEQIYDVIRDGAGNSRMFELRGPMMVKNDYSDATMKMSMWKKDMTVIGAFAASVNCPTPLLSACMPVYLAGLSHGHGAEDTASVCAVLEEMALHRRETW